MKNSYFLLSLFAAFIVISILLQSAATFSRATELDELMDDIREKSAAINALTCEFTQKRTLALFKKPIVFHGQLALIRPNRLRWEFTAPVPSVLIFDDDRGMRCNDKNEPTKFDLANDPVMRMVAEQLWTWLDGDYSKLQNNYKIEKTGESAISVRPVNKPTSDIIQDIAIVFDRESRQPESVTIREPGGDETFIIFSAYQLSPSIPESTFTECFRRD